VHKHTRTFYENEVFKSGQYRDHPANQILSKTYVQFITRYTRGRPTNWPADEKIWVCESRYNDLSKTFSKINQWRACLPEEVRFDEDDIYPFEKQRHYEKFPSPLLSLLPADAEVVAEGQKLPDPLKQGSDDAPPATGAIYRSDSPEPEKEPTPPPPHPQQIEQRHSDPVGQSLPQPMPYNKPPGLLPPQQYRPYQPPTRYNIPPRQPPPSTPPVEQPLAFTMPIVVPPEVSEVVAKDNQGRVLWFGVPPLDIVGWSGNGEVTGHSLEYLAKKRKKMMEKGEKMQDIVVSEQSEDRGTKKRATEVLVKALALIGKE
jgi:chromatin structure-remodeling complex subunit RSC1/2